MARFDDDFPDPGGVNEREDAAVEQEAGAVRIEECGSRADAWIGRLDSAKFLYKSEVAYVFKKVEVRSAGRSLYPSLLEV